MIRLSTALFRFWSRILYKMLTFYFTEPFAFQSCDVTTGQWDMFMRTFTNCKLLKGQSLHSDYDSMLGCEQFVNRNFGF